MITKEDIGAIRIVMSEVEGWNGHDVHSGKFDKQILSWVGKEWTEFLNHSWKAQKTHRVHLTDNITVLNKKIKDLGAKVKELEAAGVATPDQVIGGNIVAEIKKIK